jgi:hypothetical protein
VSAQKILVFPGEHEFIALIMDCGFCRYLAAISLRGESDNFESRIERVSGMHFLEKRQDASVNATNTSRMY